ncbi:hypothetical protein [Thauera propionica]|jgi:hypothetical protein|uniref:hypothetical protein n=1 Tax=Thauera propionica TaxID=2019431 RepID=UPI0023F4FFB0|nr:hypothetical protein [Thauera propionica]MDD3676787.1 hypothetical protein [Thauera propionica]
MSTHTPSIPCALGRIAPASPASPDELRAMRAAAWHRQGIVVVPLDEIGDAWERALLASIATRLYGARSATTQRGRPWREGEVIERGDGETWTVIAASAQCVTVRRRRDGALATLAQIGEGK